jgi:bifunctional ADP-heptose synthase (sugar kinase/adenylyltransferase)
MKILVIGDSGIDKFTYGKCSRLCPEAPVPVFTPVRETTNWGMAGNVVNNLKALGEEVLNHTNSNYQLVEKTRIVDENTNQMLVRIDIHDSCERISPDIRDLYLKPGYKKILNEIKAIIISDYNKGFLTEEDIKLIIKHYNCPIFLDTKKTLGKWCIGADFIKINQFEYDNNKSIIQELGIKDKFIITQSEKGCSYRGKNYPTKKCDVKDLSGAGDTFLAGLVHEYIKNNNIEKAIIFANRTATKVVQKRGVTTIKKTKNGRT